MSQPLASASARKAFFFVQKAKLSGDSRVQNLLRVVKKNPKAGSNQRLLVSTVAYFNGKKKLLK
jgi:hypothetical protein